MQLNFLTNKRTTLKRTSSRTVRYAAADCPQLNLADLPELPTALDKLKTILRTVRDPVADCPQYTFANVNKTNNVSRRNSSSTADCPLPISGPSAVHSANPPETMTSLDKFLILPADVQPSLADRPQFIYARPPEIQHLWTNSNLTCGLSGPPGRTVHGSSF